MSRTRLFMLAASGMRRPGMIRRWRRIMLWLAPVVALLGGLWYMTNMPGRPHAGALPPLTNEEAQLRDRLGLHVGALAGRIGERHPWRPEALEEAASYIEAALRSSGYAVTSQSFTVAGKTVRNIEAELVGTSAPGEIVLVGAHYDTVRGTPGANDNASGIAAMLEIARLLAGRPSRRSVRFVAFVNEEPPFFYTGDMGSRHYAQRTRARGENIAAMLSLETLGYYTDAPDSQRYPFPFGLVYPGTGDFVAFVGNLASRELVRGCVRSFRSHTAFPSQGLAAPGWMGSVHWSDHWSFWREGYPALMVTDTALFRYPDYHARSDTPDKLNYERLARVTSGLARLTVELARGR
ncbi:MAG: M28 family peptidase [Pseudomonadota bacterium]